MPPKSKDKKGKQDAVPSGGAFSRRYAMAFAFGFPLDVPSSCWERSMLMGDRR